MLFQLRELISPQVVRAMVDGKCVGRGRGNTKKAAKNEAAKEGLVKMEVSFVGQARL
jgi:dsRNA-specific ribonuclease